MALELTFRLPVQELHCYNHINCANVLKKQALSIWQDLCFYVVDHPKVMCVLLSSGPDATMIF